VGWQNITWRTSLLANKREDNARYRAFIEVTSKKKVQYCIYEKCPPQAPPVD